MIELRLNSWWLSSLLLIGLTHEVAAQTQYQPKDTLHLYFGTASAELIALDKERVRLWLERWSPDSLVMKAFCDSRGSLRYNDALAKQRLNAVQRLIYGVPQSQMAIGEREQLAEGSDSLALQQNRTVQVVALKKTINAPGQALETKAETAQPASDFALRLLQPNSSNSETSRPVVLDGLQFQGGTDRFLPEGQEVLAQLLQTMQTNEGLRIRITGHVCCVPIRSEDGENIVTGTKTLSLDRAMAVRKYLMEQGVSADRIEVKGVGGSKPMYWPEYTERERQGNRRVEVEAIP